MGTRVPSLLLKVLSCALSLACAAAASSRAQDAGLRSDAAAAKAAKYPLRLHVLAIDDTHQTVRMQPNWCSGSIPEVSGGDMTPCSNGSASLGGGPSDISGAGRADLVTPPTGTLGMNFTYEGCPRVRVAPGFQGLEARWRKAGSKLDVMIPTDSVTDGRINMQRCTLKVVPQEFVYLRMHNGKIVRVSQEAYTKKPSLRVFLSGGSETLERRNRVVSVSDLARPAPQQ